MAVAAWHGSGRGTTLAAVKHSCGDELPSALKKMLESDQGLVRLMVAFYFQRAGFKGQEEAFEFTHKSFGDYLTARRIVGRLGEIIEDLETERKRKRSKYGVPDALADWARICGPRKIDWDLMLFIRNEIATHPPDQCRAMQAELSTWIGYVLENGVPMEQLDGLKTFGDQNRQAINTETALLVLLDSCARVTKDRSLFEWPDEHSAANWLARIVPHEEFWVFGWRHSRAMRPTRSIVKASLRFLPLNAPPRADGIASVTPSRADLRGTDLSAADLRGTDLSGANLSGANLSGANLGGAQNLDDAILSPSQRADLKERGLL